VLVSVYVFVSVYVLISVYVFVSVYVLMSVCVLVSMYVFVSMYECEDVSVCVCQCMCVRSCAHHKRDDILQKSPIILRRLLIVAAPYVYVPLCVVGSLKLEVSSAKEPYKRGDILQKRPIILHVYVPICVEADYPRAFDMSSKAPSYEHV